MPLRFFLFVLALLTATPAFARPGIHPGSLVTWDTRASTIGFEYGVVAHDSGVLHSASYLSNFSSTTGNLGSQFGVHFVTSQPNEGQASYGLSGSAMTVIQRPILDRHPNGVSRLGVAFAFGPAPVVLVGAIFAEVVVPLVIAVGLPIAPVPWLTITPWGEVAPALTFDGSLHPEAIGGADLDSEIDDVVAEAVQYELGFGVSGRGGVEVAFHLGRVDLQLQFAGGNVGFEDAAKPAFFGGAALGVRWDRVVPDVLPDDGEAPPPEVEPADQAEQETEPATVPDEAAQETEPADQAEQETEPATVPDETEPAPEPETEADPAPETEADPEPAPEGD